MLLVFFISEPNFHISLLRNGYKNWQYWDELLYSIFPTLESYFFNRSEMQVFLDILTLRSTKTERTKLDLWHLVHFVAFYIMVRRHQDIFTRQSFFLSLFREIDVLTVAHRSVICLLYKLLANSSPDAFTVATGNVEFPQIATTTTMTTDTVTLTIVNPLVAKC